jgi:DNA-binding MarR family transcriptional regulator
LGRLTALDRNTVAVVVKKLEQKGLVDRCRRDDDRRFMQVSLTASGQATRAAAHPQVLATQDEILAPLNATEQQQLLALLQKMAEANNAWSRVPLETQP